MIKKLINGEPWFDTDGNIIHAHGGCIIDVDGTYYWYGECRHGDKLINCYSSADLRTWKFEETVIDTNCKCDLLSHAEQLYLTDKDGVKCNLERPKVVFNKETKQYVMWMHYENGVNYDCAMCGIATSDTPTGKFVFRGAFRPLGFETRDFTLFDDNGMVYLYSSSNANKDLHIYELSSDLLNVSKLSSKQFIGQYREAPAVFKRNNKYYMLSSFCTGWAPNQGKYSVSDSPYDGWSVPINFDNETTHQSQPAFVLPIKKDGDEIFLYFGDRWGGTVWGETGFDYEKSTIVCWEILFENNNITLDITDEPLNIGN